MKQKTQRQNQPILKQTAFLCCIFAALLILPTTTRAQDITTGLIGHWEFEETSGTTAADSASGLTATLQTGMNAATATSGGVLGNSFTFGGAPTDDEVYVSSASLNLEEFTYSAWYKTSVDNCGAFPGNCPGLARKILGNPPNPSSHNGWYIALRNGDPHLVIFDGSGSGNTITASTDIDDGQWHLVTYTRDSAKNNVLYVDGIARNNISDTFTIANTEALFVGANISSANSGANWDGQVDDVRYYNRALSPADITALYQSPPCFAGSKFGSEGELIYNEDYRVMQYCDSENWQSMGKGASILHGQKTEGEDYDINAVEFDGTNDYLTNSSFDPTDSMQMTFSVWLNASLTGNAWLYENGNANMYIYAYSDGRIWIRLEDNSNNLLYTRFLPAGTLTSNTWHHLMFSINTSGTGSVQIYVDDTALAAGSISLIDTEISLNATHYIGRDGGGSALFTGSVADFWLDMGTHLDLSNPANRRRFINADGQAVNLGADGSKPTGSPPDIFLSGDTANWHVNKGTGGGFTENGALTDATTLPPAQTSKQLLGWWRLDETTGTTFKDSSDNGNDATSSNITLPAASFAAPVGNGIDLTENGQSRIQTGSVNTFTNSNTFTYAAWIKPDTIDGVMGILRINGVLDMQTKFNSNELQISPNLWGTNGSFTPSTRFPIGEWTHVAMSYSYNDPVNTKPLVYLNGVAVPVGTNVSSSGAFQGMPTTAQVSIGYRGTSNGNFHGIIDDARIYNYVLSPAEIAELYAASNTYYDINGIDFDGSDRLAMTGAFTGVSDSKYVTGSFWYKANQDGGSENIMISSGNPGINITKGTTQQMRVQFENASGAVIATAQSPSNMFAIADGWVHTLFSYDTSNPARSRFYVNDVLVTTPTGFTNEDIAFSAYTNQTFQQGTDTFQIADMWMDFGTFMDLDKTANRRKFITADLHAKYLGANGELVNGTSPEIFMSGDATTWNNNAGTGGSFAVSAGALTNTPTSPQGEKRPRYCTNPSQPEGTLIYNTNDNVMQYCDGYQYIPLGPQGDGGAGCSNPSGTAGFLYYNTDFRTIEYCEGDEWIGVGRDPTPSLLAEGLVMYLPLNETSGTAAPDISGNGNNGLLVNMNPSTDWIPAVLGNGLDLDGSNDNVVVNDSASIKLGNESFSIALWVNGSTATQTNDYRVLTKGTSSGGCGGGKRYEIYNYPSGPGSLVFAVDDNSVKSAVSVDESEFLDNTWHHMLVIRDRDTNQLKIYKDGTISATAADTTGNISTSCNLYIGSENASSGNTQVKIDDVRIYNRVLSPAEIQALYDSANIDPCSLTSVTSGTTCNDGTIYAGVINYGAGNEKLFVPAEFRQSGGIRWKVSGLADADHINPQSTTDGKINAANLSASVDNFPAFELCETLDRHGYTDWYLPARNELGLLKSTSLADSATYWSSSETNNTQATANSGAFFSVDKDSSTPDVRCVRRN